MFPVYLFESQETIPGFFDSFFRGFFLIKGLPIFFQLGFLVSFLVCCYSAFLQSEKPKKRPPIVISLSAFFCLVFSAFLLFQPWDELFILLRHSENWAQFNHFSFNRFENSEGVVDFLPLFFLGTLNKLGLPLIETHFFFCILGAWFCILAGRKLLILLNFKAAENWGYLLLLLYPPLLLNSANGFMVPLFTGFLLTSIHFLFLQNRLWQGLLTLSLLPLIRLEATWFCILALIIYRYQHFKTLRFKGIYKDALVFLPILILSIWRLQHFGSAIPAPVLYKSAIGDSFYFLLGLRNFFMDFVSGGGVIWLWVLWINRKEIPRKGTEILILLFAFVIPYYLSGGDWFPPAWQRYLFPFSFFLYLLSVPQISPLIGRPDSKNIKSWVPLVLLVVFTFSLSFNSGSRLLEHLFTSKSSLAGLKNKQLGKANYRIQQLSQLGTHLQNTTDIKDRIASSELATVMYFSKREALDLLGVTNLELAKAPLRSPPRMFDKIKSQNDLPFLIFKRVKPELISKYQPSFIYTFDFFVTDLIQEVPIEEITASDLKTAIKRWDYRFKNLNGELFGGVSRLLELEYVPVIIHCDRFFSLYFVSKTAREHHFSQLKAKGMTETLLTNNHL